MPNQSRMNPVLSREHDLNDKCERAPEKRPRSSGGNSSLWLTSERPLVAQWPLSTHLVPGSTSLAERELGQFSPAHSPNAIESEVAEQLELHLQDDGLQAMQEPCRNRPERKEAHAFQPGLWLAPGGPGHHVGGQPKGREPRQTV